MEATNFEGLLKNILGAETLAAVYNSIRGKRVEVVTPEESAVLARFRALVADRDGLTPSVGRLMDEVGTMRVALAKKEEELAAARKQLAALEAAVAAFGPPSFDWKAAPVVGWTDPVPPALGATPAHPRGDGRTA